MDFLQLFKDKTEIIVFGSKKDRGSEQFHSFKVMREWLSALFLFRQKYCKFQMHVGLLLLI